MATKKSPVKAYTQVIDLIDRVTEPDAMDWKEAMQFLEELASELEDRANVLREENE